MPGLRPPTATSTLDTSTLDTATLDTAQLIDEALRIERQSPKFNPKEARVSAVGLCPRRQVVWAIDPEFRGLSVFPWLYGESGHALQHRMFLRIQAMETDALEEVCVPTPLGGWCHPDIYRPAADNATQVKTMSDAAVTSRTTHAYQVKQTLLEWHYWMKAGCCYEREDDPFSVIPGVPRTYGLLLVSRPSWGALRAYVPLKYDREKALRAAEQHERIQGHIDREEVPPHGRTRPDFECESELTGELCPLYKLCWGDTP